MADKAFKTENETPLTGLALLRSPFPVHQISKLPKPTKAQTDAVKEDFRKGVRCQLCGSWHHPDVVHLDYVGHAALTDRLLDCDPEWNWEPFALSADGAPLLDKEGGLWIRLTVCAITRNGYGHADGKKGGDAIKETIGDALRNAAMRFGAALDLWHKGDLHLEPEGETEPLEPSADEPAPKTKAQGATKANSRDLFKTLQAGLRNCKSSAELRQWGEAYKDEIKKMDKSFADEIRAEYKAERNAFIDQEEDERQREAGEYERSQV